MADNENEEDWGSRRRVYVLPEELIDRIVAFQKAKSLPSEVEAVRRLLDESLMSRDTYRDLIKRFTSRMRDNNFMSDIAKDVLVGHPLVKSLELEDDFIKFKMRDNHEVSIYSSKKAQVFNENYALIYDSDDDEIPF